MNDRPLLRFIGVCRNDDGTFSVFDIVEPLPRYTSQTFRYIHREAQRRSGYVLVGRSGAKLSTFRRVD
jgi:hypothetical protein